MLLAVLAIMSCSSEQTVSNSKVRSDLDKYNGGYDLEKDEHGMTRSGSDKVSQYDEKRSNIRGQDYSGKSYNKENYRKERWGGDKDYAAKQYGGNTDGSKFKHSPYYVTRNANARANGQYSSNDQSRFNAGTYNTGRANESRSDAVKTGGSSYAASRNRKATKPLIISKDDYTKLGVQDTNRMLGR